MFLPAVIFVMFLTIMFSIYKMKNLPRGANEATLGETNDVDNQVKLDAQ
jgi:hypothetical protein